MPYVLFPRTRYRIGLLSNLSVSQTVSRLRAALAAVTGLLINLADAHEHPDADVVTFEYQLHHVLIQDASNISCQNRIGARVMYRFLRVE
jgi:hypothetical protein